MWEEVSLSWNTQPLFWIFSGIPNLSKNTWSNHEQSLSLSNPPTFSSQIIFPLSSLFSLSLPPPQLRYQAHFPNLGSVRTLESRVWGVYVGFWMMYNKVEWTELFSHMGMSEWRGTIRGIRHHHHWSSTLWW